MSLLVHHVPVDVTRIFRRRRKDVPAMVTHGGRVDINLSIFSPPSSGSLRSLILLLACDRESVLG